MKFKTIQLVNIVNQLSQVISTNSIQIPDAIKAFYFYARPEAQTFYELSEAERIAFKDVEIEVPAKRVESKAVHHFPIDVYNSLEPLIRDFEEKKSNLQKMVEEKDSKNS